MQRLNEDSASVFFKNVQNAPKSIRDFVNKID